jgi:hypothetical protein
MYKASRLTVSIYRLQKFKLMTANTVINTDNESMETMGTDQVTLLFGTMCLYLFVNLTCELCIRISIMGGREGDPIHIPLLPVLRMAQNRQYSLLPEVDHLSSPIYNLKFT